MKYKSNHHQLETYREHIEISRIGKQAVRAAQQEARDRGLASVYSRNGRLYWELPNGDITFEDPYKAKPVSRRPTSST